MTLPAMPLLGRTLLRSTAALLTLSLLFTLCLVGIAAGVLLLARADATREADTDALNIARAAGQDIARNLALYDLSLQTVVRQLSVPGVVTLDPELRQSLLFDGASRDQHFGFINAIDANGAVIADSASPTPRGGNFASRDYFRAQRDHDTLYIGRPFLTDPGQPTMITISRRMAHRDGSFAGVVVGSMRIGYFAELFSRFSLGAHGAISLLRDDGMLLQRMPAAAGQIGAIPDVAGLPRLQPLVPADIADPVDHRLRRMVAYPIEGLPLAIMVGLAPEDIYAAWRSKAAIIGAAILALGGVNTLLLLWLQRLMRRQQASETALRASDKALRASETALHEQHEELISLILQGTDRLEMDKLAHDRRSERLAEVSHDIRTLLQSILGNAELIPKKGSLAADQARCVAAIRVAGEHLCRIADRFLSESRDNTGATRVPLQPIDVRRLIAECHSMVGLAAEQKGLHLAFEVDEKLPDRIVTDGTRLSVILCNLLDNAIKYTDQGSVGLRVSQEPQGIRCIIADSGRGMPDLQAQRLLEEPRPTGSTSGLGLSIVQRHARQLGGTISCLRNPCGGSIICLDLPTAPLPAAPGGPAPADALRILLVDDSEISRGPTADLLQAAGHQVTQAVSGEQAVQLADQQCFDVILMDMRMRGMDGLEATRRIRALPDRHMHAPIIALTAELVEHAPLAWRKAGVDAYLAKPCDQAQLLQAIARVTSGRPSAAAPRELAATQAMAASPPATDQHLWMLSEQLQTMLALLDGAPSGEPESARLDELVHQLAGDAAQLGFTTVAAQCRALERALHTGGETVMARRALTGVTRAAIADLRQRFQDPRKGEFRSAMPL